MSIKILESPNGLTIRQLKKLIKDWPETDRDGEEYTVWIETGLCMSSIVIDVFPLNKGEDGADILFESGAFRL